MKNSLKKLRKIQSQSKHWNLEASNSITTSCSGGTNCSDIGSQCHGDGQCGGDGE